MNAHQLLSLVIVALLCGCVSLEPTRFPENHPANASASIAHELPQESILRAHQLPKPHSPLAEAATTAIPVDAHDHSTVSGKQGTLYTCPMHPEIIRDQPGKCPICGMPLVLKKPEATEPEMQHDHGAEK